MKTLFFLILSISLMAQESKYSEEKFYNYVGVSLDTLINYFGYPDGQDYSENGIKIIWFERNDGKAFYTFSNINETIGNSVFLSKQGDDVGTVFWYSIYQGLLLKDGFTLVNEETKPKKSHYIKNNLHITLELYKDNTGHFIIEARAFIL